ncbi:unnamed protein product [Cyclocybe aegerita]|uniref:F-box domain-containing protein n=1 Tax=Cyclocybe aegerita TaxID=1973307 RepID=A0A8S0WT93_CYCAE|nr:unnamed protein product [Cyclocybe aegerita]
MNTGSPSLGASARKAGLTKTPRCSHYNNRACKFCSEVDALEGRIHQAQLLLSDLFEAHRDLMSLDNDVHDPMRNLPPEVVSLVFVFCTTAGHPANREYDENTRRKVQPPLLLGAVCRRWREVAWSTPALWTRICVVIRSVNPHCQVGTAERWLSRSGQLPLSIHIRFPAGDILDPPSPRPHPIIPLLNRYSSRWAELDIDVVSFGLLRHLFGDLIEGASILKTLSIGRRATYARPTAAFSIRNFTPSPHVVKIYSISFRLIGISWANVTHVELGMIFIDESYQLFRLAPQLMNCWFNLVDEGAGGFGMPDDIVVLQHLQRLKLSEFYSKPLVEPFFAQLGCPSLTSLEWGGVYDVSSLPPFLARSSCPLTFIDLSGVGGTEEELINLFYGTPFVTTLKLCFVPAGDAFLELLASTVFSSVDSEDESTFLPNLRRLEFRNDKHFSWSSVPPIFRLEPPSPDSIRRPLESLSLDKYFELNWDPIIDFIDEETLSEILRIRERGVELIMIAYGFGGVDIVKASLEHHREQKRKRLLKKTAP